MYKKSFLSPPIVFIFGKPLKTMFKGVARITIYILICIPLLVIAFLITKQVQSAFELRKSFIDGNFVSSPIADLQQMMATSELSTRSFFLIFFCFLMILCGLLIVLKGTGNALRFTKEPKVAYSLKTAYPGLVMAIVGCLLLTYSIYKSAQLHFETTNELLTLRGESSSVLSTLPVSDPPPMPRPIVDTIKPSVESPATSEIVQVTRNVDSVKRESKVVKQTLPVATPDKKDERIITREEVKWAGDLAIRSITNGYSPTSKDKVKYDQITTGSNRNEEYNVNPQLNWAFHFLMRTQKGYQPTSDELNKYERVVSNYINKKPKHPENEGDRVSR